MKIVVDNKGWMVVEETPKAADSNEKASSETIPKTSSGVYAKTTAVEDPAVAPTEPSPPTEEAIASGEMAFPPPASLPPDLVALTADPKVA